MNKTTVVNTRDLRPEDWTDQHIYIGRGGWWHRKRLPPSTWGNHYRIGKDGTREECVAKFRADFKGLEKYPEAMAYVRQTFRGKILVCHCAPLPCHGEIYAELADLP